MTRAAPPEPPPEAPEPHSREKYLTLTEHLSEIRYRLTVCAVAVVIGPGVSWFFAGDIIDFLQRPAKDASGSVQFQFLEPFENFLVYFKVSLLGALTLAMPVIVWHVLAFLAPGLNRNERWWLIGTVVGAGFLFVGGVVFAYYLALPPALDFLLNFGNDTANPNIRIGSYIDFVTRLLFWTGVSFEMPVIVMYLARFRVVNARQLLHWWRLALVGAFVIAAVITPSVDPVTQTVVAIPIVVLYFVSIVLAFIVQPRKREEA